MPTTTTRLLAALLSGTLVAAAPFGASAGRVKEEAVSDDAGAKRLGAGLLLETDGGEPLDLGDLAGQRLLVVTWASW